MTHFYLTQKTTLLYKKRVATHLKVEEIEDNTVTIYRVYALKNFTNNILKSL